MGRVNWSILAAVGVATNSCLWLASHAPWWIGLGAAAAFALLNNTAFALMHEAVHGIGAGTPRSNYLLGVAAGCLFPTSFTMQKAAHLGHHARNRTDLDLYDYYLPHESRWLRNLWLYGGNLLGLYWFCIPLSNALYLVAPGLYRSRLFTLRIAPALGFGRYIRDLVKLPARRVRVEIALGLAYQAALWWSLDLGWRGWLFAHWLFALHWSSLQYVDHAWSPRDISNGAWDLRVTALSRWLALNYHCHLAHHRHPDVAWVRLPEFASREGQPSFWQIYRSLWRHGVQPAPAMGAPAGTSLFSATEEESH